MKRFIAFCTALLLLVSSGCGTEISEPPQDSPPQEIRAVWISYLELTLQPQERSRDAFFARANKMVQNIRNGKMNTVFLHVRAFSDALYPSDIFPFSSILTGTEGVDPGYDPLQIFCDLAKEAGLSVHAWINPFRIGDADSINDRSDGNPAKRYLCDDDPDNDSFVFRAGNTLYYDPASEEVQTMILDGVRELLRTYPLDGIHIDDYFYPTTEEYADSKEYEAYIRSGGTESRDDWRRATISRFVSRMYTCVKSFGEDKIFSISPSLDIDNNRSKLYADVEKWCAYAGFCDWMIPQVYVGFSHESAPFCDVVRRWSSLPRDPQVRLLFGLAAYKCGTEDAYAGSGRREWIEHTDILSGQIAYIRENADCSGFSLFSYSYCFGENLSNNSMAEINSVIPML